MRSIGSTSYDDGEVTLDIRILEERWRDRAELKFNTGEFRLYDMYKNMNNDHTYTVEEKLPWQETEERADKYERERKAKSDAS